VSTACQTCAVAAYLVTGNPGSGKSMMMAELTRRGFQAMDTDEIAGWVDDDDRPAVQPAHLTARWLASHRWVWTRAAFEQVLCAAGTAPMFFCGIAVNQRDMLDLFERVFLLTLDPCRHHRASGDRSDRLRSLHVTRGDIDAGNLTAVYVVGTVGIRCTRTARLALNRNAIPTLVAAGRSVRCSG